MITIYSLTSFIILLYLFYPVWLMLSGKADHSDSSEPVEIDGVTVILLSYNGKKYLQEKIGFLIRELACFHQYELIIIDDNSQDGSDDLLKDFTRLEHIQVLENPCRRGIPYSMNIGVAKAAFNNIVFCDQRQELSEGILRKIIEPLKDEHIGAVSACISTLDKESNHSFLRSHENFLKMKESQSGCLMGVYGPLYALKKPCYCPIPENIILDDLYLSLSILKSKQIEIRNDCQIVEDNFSELYDYRRARRYLKGLLQILKARTIIGDLSGKQQIMLMWHKYLRLIIPVCLFLCYISLGVAVIDRHELIVFFFPGTVLVAFSMLPVKFNSRFRLSNLIRMNVFYFLACWDIMLNDIIFRQFVKPGISGYDVEK
ncbi:MAG: glycosyltransferase [Bacteroidetes bacterium]|nr:glycosyltransferase [Bacteroidota bacterium]